MLRSSFAACLGAAVFLAGCATSPSQNTAPAAPAPAPAAAAPTAPVVVPAAAARRVVLTVTGPKTVTEAKDWPAFKQEWRDVFAEHAKDAGVSFAFVETGAPQIQAEGGTLVQVTVNDYRMVGIGSRIFFGVMTGNAYVDARVRFADLRTGMTFGEQSINTSSSAWGGIVARVTPQQVDAIATEVFKPIKAAR